MKDIKTKLSIVYNELWPHIAKSEKPSCNEKVLEGSVCSSSDMDFLLSEAKDSFKIEEDRMKQVEQKANISIGITGVIATVIASLFSASLTEPHLLDIFFFMLFLIYSLRTITYSIKVLRKKYYAIPNLNDYISYSSYEAKSKIIVDYLNATSFNRSVNNKKTDSMQVSQESFRNAVVCICILGIMKLLIISPISCLF